MIHAEDPSVENSVCFATFVIKSYQQESCVLNQIKLCIHVCVFMHVLLFVSRCDLCACIIFNLKKKGDWPY